MEEKKKMQDVVLDPGISALAVLLLEESRKKGNTIEIPSLGIKIKPDEDIKNDQK